MFVCLLLSMFLSGIGKFYHYQGLVIAMWWKCPPTFHYHHIYAYVPYFVSYVPYLMPYVPCTFGYVCVCPIYFWLYVCSWFSKCFSIPLNHKRVNAGTALSPRLTTCLATASGEIEKFLADCCSIVIPASPAFHANSQAIGSTLHHIEVLAVDRLQVHPSWWMHSSCQRKYFALLRGLNTSSLMRGPRSVSIHLLVPSARPFATSKDFAELALPEPDVDEEEDDDDDDDDCDALAAGAFAPSLIASVALAKLHVLQQDTLQHRRHFPRHQTHNHRHPQLQIRRSLDQVLAVQVSSCRKAVSIDSCMLCHHCLHRTSHLL